MMYGTSKEDEIIQKDKERINKLLEIKTWDSDSKRHGVKLSKMKWRKKIILA